MTPEQIQKIITTAERRISELQQMSEEWKDAVQILHLGQLAQRADTIGDIKVESNPRHDANPEFDHPNNLRLVVKNRTFPDYLIDDVDVAILFGLGVKYLDPNDAQRFVAFATRMLGIETGWSQLGPPRPRKDERKASNAVSTLHQPVKEE